MKRPVEQQQKTKTIHNFFYEKKQNMKTEQKKELTAGKRVSSFFFML
jgi:hypothetical protein